MFVWSLLKRGIPGLVWLCIGNLPMYIFFIPMPSLDFYQFCIYISDT